MGEIMSFIGKTLGKITGASDAAKAAERASGQQVAASEAAIEEQRRQFDALQELLKPFVEGGRTALGAQQQLIGLGTPEEQAAAIAQLEQSPMMRALTQKGENAILQQASATGGLRGGNTQAALAQFRPQMLAQLIENQYGRLGGLSTLGANAAVGQGTAGMGMAGNIGNLLNQIGASQAGATMARGNVASQGFGAGLGIAGLLGGLGLFGKASTAAKASTDSLMPGFF